MISGRSWSASWGRLVAWALQQGLPVTATVTEVGSGMNGSRPKLRRLLSDPKVGTIVVEHRDRLARLGSQYVEAALSGSGRRLIVVEGGEVEDDLGQMAAKLWETKVDSDCAPLSGLGLWPRARHPQRYVPAIGCPAHAGTQNLALQLAARLLQAQPAQPRQSHPALPNGDGAGQPKGVTAFPFLLESRRTSPPPPLLGSSSHDLRKEALIRTIQVAQGLLRGALGERIHPGELAGLEPVQLSVQLNGLGAATGPCEVRLPPGQAPVVGEAGAAGVLGQVRSLAVIGIQLVTKCLMHHTALAAQRKARAALVRAERRP